MERAVRHSLCFDAFDGREQVGFARVVSDHATYAYISDVFVLDSHRGRGVGKRLMAAIVIPSCRACAAGRCSRETRTASTGNTASARLAIQSA